MSSTVIEVIYGKHSRYEVIKSSGLFGTSYLVRRSDGKTSGTFSRLDWAVRWAQEKARNY